VVDQTIFGGVSLGLKCTEERFLCTKDLNRRGRILGQVGQGTGVRDETGGNDLSDELGQVGSNDGHLVSQVVKDLLAEVGKRVNFCGEGQNVLHICI